jgi:plastocyanin
MRRLLVFAAAFIALSLGSLNLAAAGGGCKPPTGTTEGNGALVKVANCSFGPTILHAPVGAKITWYNGDYLAHAINGLGWDATTPFEPANPGTSVSHAFGQPGIYPYMCYVHPGMTGIIVVGDVAFNPNADGAMRLDALANPQAAPVAAAPAIAAAATTTPTVDLPIAIALAVLAATVGYAFARIPRYRLHGGALAIRRRHGIHTR